MHELSIVEGLINIIEDTAREHDISSVKRVKLRIGAMRQVVPDALRFAFEVAGKGTVAEGAEILITDIPTKAKCGTCAGEFQVEEYCFICPRCGSSEVTVIEGKELYIDTLEGE